MNPIIMLIAITVSDKYGRKGALPHLKLVGRGALLLLPPLPLMTYNAITST